jgi:vesicle coat complex subunit
VIADLCAALESLEEPEAKGAMVWILGEYADKIDNADELLGFLLDSFLDEPVAVQLQLLSAAVKLFLKCPAAAGAQGMISSVLTAATQQTDNPDLRDRAFMYWRMLAAMPEARFLPLPLPCLPTASCVGPSQCRSLAVQRCRVHGRPVCLVQGDYTQNRSGCYRRLR